MNRPLIALQFYTVRDHAETDMLGTLRRVAAMGYEGVELGGGYGNASREETLQTLRDSGLQVVGTHTSIDALQADLQAVVDEQNALGSRFTTVSYLAEKHRGSAANWQQTARALDGFGRQLREAGITLCYHNHDFEFTERFGEGDDAAFGLDILLANSDPQNLKAELDVYWTQKGGVDPAAYLRKYACRVPLLHIKDMATNGGFAEIGAGTLNWTGIFTAAEDQDVQTYIVEQDICPGDSFDSAQLSIDNLRGMGKLG